MAKKEEERKEVRVRLESLYLDTFDGPLDDVMLTLQEFKERYSDTHTGLHISAWQRWDDLEINLFGFRLETDAEYNKRIAAAEKARERANKTKEALDRKKQEKQLQLEANERAEYERLKAKFGG